MCFLPPPFALEISPLPSLPQKDFSVTKFHFPPQNQNYRCYGFGPSLVNHLKNLLIFWIKIPLSKLLKPMTYKAPFNVSSPKGGEATLFLF